MKKQKLSVSPTKKYKASPTKPNSFVLNFSQQNITVDSKIKAQKKIYNNFLKPKPH
jgi:hypothetical protein